MDWIKSYRQLARHPKIKRLARALYIPEPAALGHLHLLWYWAVDFAPDGDISKFDAEAIAYGAAWEPADYDENRHNEKPDAFLVALVDTGWVDEQADGIRVLHDWLEYVGRDRTTSAEGGSFGNHKRWHVDRGVVLDTCRFCAGQSGGDSGRLGGATRGESPKSLEEKREEEKRKTNTRAPTQASGGDDFLEEEFEKFWQQYPRRNGKRLYKHQAESAYIRLSKSQRERARNAVVHYANACNGGLTLAKDAFRWLRDHAFDDWQTPAVVESAARAARVPDKPGPAAEQNGAAPYRDYEPEVVGCEHSTPMCAECIKANRQRLKALIGQVKK